MPRGPLLAGFLVVATSLACAALVVGEGVTLAPGAGALLAAVLIALAVIVTSGIMLARSRWSRWSAIGLLAACAVIVSLLDIAWGWKAGVTAAAVIGALAAGRGSMGWFRKRPSAQGPPPESVALILSLVAFPAAIAAFNHDGISTLAVLGATVIAGAALVYTRSGVPSLWAMRALVPLGVGLAVAGTSFPIAVVVGVLGGALVAATWLPPVRQAAVPLIPLRSPGYKIPAELVPPEVLDAAGLDERGRRR